MITYERLIARIPALKEKDKATVEFWITRANTGLPDARFVDGFDPDYGRMLFVSHNVNKPPLNVAWTTRPPVRGNAPHPWHSTEHGKVLAKAVKL